MIYPKNRAYNYVYFFLESWKYIITVLKSKYITIFNFSEFKMKTNNGDFQKKGRWHQFLHIFIVRTTRFLVYRCLSFCSFSFGRCVVCHSSIYRFWLPHWYFWALLLLHVRSKNWKAKNRYLGAGKQ